MNAKSELEKLARTGINSTEETNIEPVPSNAVASDYCGGSFLRAADLNGDTIVTISSIGEKLMKDEDRPKLVLLFEEFDLPLILNVTNTKTISELHGEEIKNWKGRKFTLYSTKVPYNGKLVDSIRIRA